MSVELISVLVAVLALGATLGGLILTSLRGTEARLGAQIKDLRGEVGELRERMAKLEGLAGRIARGYHRTGRGG